MPWAHGEASGACTSIKPNVSIFIDPIFLLSRPCPLLTPSTTPLTTTMTLKGSWPAGCSCLGPGIITLSLPERTDPGGLICRSFFLLIPPLPKGNFTYFLSHHNWPTAFHFETPFIKKYLPTWESSETCTTYMLNDYSSDYQSRLKSLQLVPLLYFSELFVNETFSSKVFMAQQAFQQ